MRLLPAVLAACLLAGIASAQERSPAARETLVDLAYTLGQAHALRVRCEGPSEQVWRARMARLVELEKPDEAFRDQLLEGFNTGYLSAGAAHLRCDEEARAEAARVAGRGRDLARVLAGAR